MQPDQTTKEKEKKGLDNYRLSVIVSLIIVLLLIISLLIIASVTNNIDFLFTASTNWFINFIFIPAFIGRIISGNSYIGRLIDSFTIRKDSNQYFIKTIFCILIPADRKIKFYEKWLTVLGVLVGITAATLIIAHGNSIAFFSSLSYFADVIFCLGTVSMFAGLGNRAGCCLDNNEGRKENERKAMKASILIGLLSGISLFFALNNTAILISITGVSAFLSGGLILPFFLGGIFFVLSFSSMCSSFADYAMRTWNFLQPTDTNDEAHFDKKRYHEYRGATIGTLIGIAIGIGICMGLVTTGTLPFSLTLFIVAPVIIMSCIAVMGALFSRIGRIIDVYWPNMQNTGILQSEEIPKTNLPSSPMDRSVHTETTENTTIKQNNSKTDPPIRSNAELLTKISMICGDNTSKAAIPKRQIGESPLPVLPIPNSPSN